MKYLPFYFSHSPFLVLVSTAPMAPYMEVIIAADTLTHKDKHES